MKFIADFHIHSHYSLATSSRLIPEYLEYWARIKGLNVLGTGDCVHPGWLRELHQKLEPAGNGLFRLKSEYQLPESRSLADSVIPGPIYFMLTGEISSIYKKDGRTRKVHNICVFPDFKGAEKFQHSLEELGCNISSDGRPIVGVDSRDILEMTLSSQEGAYLIPAHIWTPWFSVLGSKSGFDSLQECYGDLTCHIKAVETGLSSDPPMNHVCSFLDGLKLVSNSDAHSPDKLGREANLFDCEMSFNGISSALSGDSGFDGTIEFFPQEGKYHFDGHRKCGIRWNPLETLQHGGICPVCGKPVTKGVMYRVAQLADRTDPSKAPGRKNFYSIAALPEIIAQLRGVKNPSSASVQKEFFSAVRNLGAEFSLLLFTDLDDIRRSSGDLLAEGIRRLRAGEISLEEGYDGEFGRVRIFEKDEKEAYEGNMLFPVNSPQAVFRKASACSMNFDIEEFRKESLRQGPAASAEPVPSDLESRCFSPEQTEGILHVSGPCMVTAGPGSGKTSVLTARIISLINSGAALPSEILAVTFSSNAAEEMRRRLKKDAVKLPDIMTFHAFGLSVLKKYFFFTDRSENFMLLDSTGSRALAEKAGGNADDSAAEIYKRGGSAEKPEWFDAYEKALKEADAFDLNDLIRVPVMLMENHPDIAEEYRKKYRFILVDEFQDINPEQYRMLKLLAPEPYASVFVIGDPDQSIYSFRGADPYSFLRFEKDHPGLKKIILRRSFRCPEPVVEAAAQAIRQKKQMTGKASSAVVSVTGYPTDKSEAEGIASAIENMMGGVRTFSIDSGISDGTALAGNTVFSDFAVLCRSSFMFDEISRAFRNHGIPWEVSGNGAFYTEQPFAEIISAVRNAWYGRNVQSDDGLSASVRDSLKKGTEPLSLITELAAAAGADKKAVRKFKKLCSGYKSPEELFSSLSLGSGEVSGPSADAVSLMTIHASKGLEFRYVFIPGCEEGIIPFTLFGNTSPEEEERIFYVGATRTAEALFLSHAEHRVFQGRTLSLPESSLISRIREKLVERHQQTLKKKAEDLQLELF